MRIFAQDLIGLNNKYKMSYTHVLEAFMPITEFDKLMSNKKTKNTKFYQNLVESTFCKENEIDIFAPVKEFYGELFRDITWGFAGNNLANIEFAIDYQGDKSALSNSLADFIHNPSIFVGFDEETADSKEDLIESALELIDCNIVYKACEV